MCQAAEGCAYKPRPQPYVTGRLSYGERGAPRRRRPTIVLHCTVAAVGMEQVWQWWRQLTRGSVAEASQWPPEPVRVVRESQQIEKAVNDECSAAQRYVGDQNYLRAAVHIARMRQVMNAEPPASYGITPAGRVHLANSAIQSVLTIRTSQRARFCTTRNAFLGKLVDRLGCKRTTIAVDDTGASIALVLVPVATTSAAAGAAGVVA